jgi:hypothetical protein
MSVIRLANGADIVVKLSLEEVRDALGAGDPADFVELPGENGPILVRPASVLAIIGDAKRGTAGFRLAQGASQAS